MKGKILAFITAILFGASMLVTPVAMAAQAKDTAGTAVKADKTKKSAKKKTTKKKAAKKSKKKAPKKTETKA